MVKRVNGLGLRDERGEVVTILVVLLLLVAVLFGGYKLVGVAADFIAEKIPDKMEAELFGELGARDSSWRADASTDARQRAKAVFDKLVEAKDLRQLRYRLFFISDPDPNAFAMPGGAIAVTDGLLAMLEGNIGLAMVIGHEFGHQQHRHSLRSLGRSLIVAGIVALTVGDVSAIVSLIMGLAEKSHSREQELQADDYGIRMVHKVFGMTAGATEFFEKMEKNSGSTGGKLLSMLSTHPYTPDRIAQIKKLQKQLESEERERPTKKGKTR